MNNKIKNLTLLLLTLTLGACATMQARLKSSGYSDADIALMKPYIDEYNSRIASSFAFGGPFGSMRNEDTLQVVFCNCYKKLGDLCRRPSDEVSEKDRVLWAKANAAEYSVKSQAFGNGPTLDKDECAI